MAVMKVLVSGASGFIGKSLLKEFRRRGIQVASIGRSGLIVGDEVDKTRCLDLETGRIPKDFLSFGFDALVHLAWNGLPNYHHVCHLNQIKSHLKFIERAQECGIRKLFIAGTCLEYGKKEGELFESDDCEPTTNYGRAKLEVFNEIANSGQMRSADLTWGRIFYVYGKLQRSSALYPQIVEVRQSGEPLKLKTDGRQIRDFIPVFQVSSIIASLIMSEKPGGIVNIGSGAPTSVSEWAAKLLENTKSNLILGTERIPDYEPMESWANVQKLQSLLKNIV